jgi:hypothetical protein
MNQRIAELHDLAIQVEDNGDYVTGELDPVKFAELIVRECVNTLEFHGFDDAVPYIQWMATNKLGVEP